MIPESDFDDVHTDPTLKKLTNELVSLFEYENQTWLVHQHIDPQHIQIKHHTGQTFRITLEEVKTHLTFEHVYTLYALTAHPMTLDEINDYNGLDLKSQVNDLLRLGYITLTSDTYSLNLGKSL